MPRCDSAIELLSSASGLCHPKMGTAMYYAALLALLSVLSSLQPTLGYVALSPWKNGRSTFYGVGDGTKGGSVNDWVRVHSRYSKYGNLLVPQSLFALPPCARKLTCSINSACPTCSRSFLISIDPIQICHPQFGTRSCCARKPRCANHDTVSMIPSWFLLENFIYFSPFPAGHRQLRLRLH